MDSQFNQLKETLRAEKCPPEVIARVQKIIERERSARSPVIPVWFGAAGLAAALALAGIMAWVVGLSPFQSPEPVPMVTQDTDNQKAVREAFLSLAYVGAVLIETGQHAEDSLLEDASDPVKNQYNNVKHILIRNL